MDKQKIRNLILDYVAPALIVSGVLSLIRVCVGFEVMVIAAFVSIIISRIIKQTNG